jgi:PD-(D/E)XK endonuclease
MDSPSAKGARSEAAILHALVAAGRTVLLPWGGHHRYDFLIDEGDGRFTRVQCKSGVYRRGAVFFRTCSADRRRPMGDAYFGQVDAFGVYCPALGRAFLVPINDLPVRQLAALRLEPPANGQVGAIRWAQQYELPHPATSLFVLERKTGFEPAAPALARLCATAAPLPLGFSNDI